MQEISVSLIEQAIYKMCKDANIFLPQEVYEKIKISSKYDKQNIYILENAKISAETQKPLCQDTGQVIVFAKIGQDVYFVDGSFQEAINNGVEKCYKENYFRKSVVKDALQDRANTLTNTPCVIHTELIDGEQVELQVMIKGGGSENVTSLRLLKPTSNKDELYKNVLDIVKSAQKNACPPLFIGLGVGQTADSSILLSKMAIIDGNENLELHELLNKNLDIGLNVPVLSVKQLSASTHIACMPLGVTILCHSNKYNSCIIKNNEITYTTKLFNPLKQQEKIDEIDKNDLIKVNGNEISLVKKDAKILFSGKIYTARDAAHKRLVEMLNNGQNLPIDLENAVIFYAGPCPNSPEHICNSIGPTTAKRMDDFAVELYENGVIATLAKGQRSENILDYLKKSGKKYFEIQGGIAAYLSTCVKSIKMVAFEDLGTEAIYELEVEDLPMSCVE